MAPGKRSSGKATPRAAVESRLAQLRAARGLAAADLARRTGSSRQTIYAIEAGAYVPNTELALRLARELEVPVEELFALRDAAPSQADAKLLATDCLVAGGGPPRGGQPVRVASVGPRVVSVPVSASPYYLPEADGVIQSTRGPRVTGRSELFAFPADEFAGKRPRVVLAGCDPATGILAAAAERIAGVEVVCAGASSRLALQWLAEGKVHLAGSHLEDRQTGEFNLPFLQSEFEGEEFTVVTFAQWEQGLVVAPGNPKAIRGVEHLARRGVRFVNREPGSGSRALLDGLLERQGIPAARISGYGREVFGHLGAAYSVMSGVADVCLATRSAARAFQLDFVPLRAERYDFVMLRRTAALPEVQALLDVLQRASLRRRLENLAGYDTSQTGSIRR